MKRYMPTVHNWFLIEGYYFVRVSPAWFTVLWFLYGKRPLAGSATEHAAINTGFKLAYNMHYIPV